MKLSEAEKTLVAKLKKRQQDFRRFRWIFLLLAVLCAGVGVYGLTILYLGFRSTSAFTGVAIFLTPVAFFFFLLGVWLAADTLISWRGRAEVDLLLKLFEDSRDDA